MSENDDLLKRIAAERQERAAADATGLPALLRLVAVAKRDSGQALKVRRLLLGCYNGETFPFDLTDLRCLDQDLFDDCLRVLRMDRYCTAEVHRRFEGGDDLFEAWAVAEMKKPKTVRWSGSD